MKRIIIFLGILFFASTVYAKGSIDISKSSINMDIGKTEEFVISANNAAGLVTIKSTDTSIIAVDQEKYFFDSMISGNDKLVVKITAKKAGTAKVNVVIEDVTTYDEEVLKGTKEVQITVNENNPVSPTDTPIEPEATTPEPEINPTIVPTDNPSNDETDSNSNKINSKSIIYIALIVVLLIVIGFILRSLLKKKNY